MSEVILTSVQEWRRRVSEGTLSIEEMRAAIDSIRKERIGASGVSAESKVKKAVTAKKKEVVDSDALLGELGL